MREILIEQIGRGSFRLTDSDGEQQDFDILGSALDEATFRCRWTSEYTLKVKQIGKEVREKFRTAPTTKELEQRGDNPDCPDCGIPLYLQEGCIKCTACGFSEC